LAIVMTDLISHLIYLTRKSKLKDLISLISGIKRGEELNLKPFVEIIKSVLEFVIEICKRSNRPIEECAILMLAEVIKMLSCRKFRRNNRDIVHFE